MGFLVFFFVLWYLLEEQRPFLRVMYFTIYPNSFTKDKLNSKENSSRVKNCDYYTVRLLSSPPTQQQIRQYLFLKQFCMQPLNLSYDKIYHKFVHS